MRVLEVAVGFRSHSYHISRCFDWAAHTITRD